MRLKLKKFKTINAGENPPDVSFLPMLARRKLDMTGKIVLSLANAVAGGESGYKSVFSSRYGCLNGCIKLFESLNSGAGVSPNGFSSSVHNFPIGMQSILSKNKESYTAIAAGENSLELGVLEAFAQQSKVFFVCAQEPLLSVIDAEGEEPQEALGIAFYAEPAPENGDFELTAGQFANPALKFEGLKNLLENGGEICGKFIKLSLKK
ncbi:MAG: beta-ketoacyl synthase chain length factor [Opitutales bacterium]|nr:beta-ketoacyl synthase chain length factor [Opitutales bacterium]